MGGGNLDEDAALGQGMEVVGLRTMMFFDSDAYISISTSELLRRACILYGNEMAYLHHM